MPSVRKATNKNKFGGNRGAATAGQTNERVLIEDA